MNNRTGRQTRHCEALVLRHIDYGEADRIFTLLTAGQGLQKGFARAARQSRKRFGGCLQPFTRVRVLWRPGRGSLWSLQDAELLRSHPGLQRSLGALSLASYGVELVEMLLREGEEAPRVYQLLCAFLDYLDGQGDAAVARLLFELRLIALLGYMPHLLHCSECQQGFGGRPLFFSARRGGSLCSACSSGDGLAISLGTVGSLARSLQTPLQSFTGFRFGETTRGEAAAMLRQVLSELLPREPKSLKFLNDLSVQHIDISPGEG